MGYSLETEKLMKEKFTYWKYLGLSKETLLSFRDRVAYDNLRMLFTESVGIGILCFISSVIMVLSGTNITKPVVLITTAFANFVIAFFAGELRQNGARHLYDAVKLLILIFKLVFYGMSIFIGIYDYTSFAALFTGVVVLAQVSFDILPLDNVAASVFACATYFVLALLFKDSSIVYYEALDIMGVAILGNIIAWNKSKVKYEREESIELAERSNSQMYRVRLVDSLTGVLNRRNAFDKLEVLTAQSGVSAREIVCIILDLDDFKSFNDTYGHIEGDRLLQDVGQLLTSINVKYSIPFGRTEGEEFMGFWMPSKADEAEAIAEEIREKVKSIEHPLRREGKYSTVSVGIYQGVASVSDTASTIYSKARNAVYDAKRNGRDCIEFYDNSIEK